MLNTSSQLKTLLVRYFPYLVSSIRHYIKSKKAERTIPQGSLWGFKFCGPSNMLSGKFEDKEITQITRFFDSVDTFIDIGANIGLYSCLARSNNLDVISVEPEYFNVQILLKNLQINNWDDVAVLPIGVGSGPSIANLYGGGTGASLLEGWSGGSATHQKIPVNTIDSVVSQISRTRRLAIKLDVEGFEYEALLGAKVTLSLHPKPIWFVEIDFDEHHPDGINPNFSRIFDIFWQNGYKCQTLDDNLQEVMPEDIENWTNSRSRGFGGHNYVFTDKNSDLNMRTTD